mgnify:CR=1 FL=1
MPDDPNEEGRRRLLAMWRAACKVAAERLPEPADDKPTAETDDESPSEELIARPAFGCKPPTGQA